MFFMMAQKKNLSRNKRAAGITLGKVMLLHGSLKLFVLCKKLKKTQGNGSIKK